MKIKILFIIPELSRGGAQNVLLNIIKILPQHDYDISLLYFGIQDSMVVNFKAMGVTIFIFDNTNIKMNFLKFRAMLKSINPDIIHTHLPPGYFIIFLYIRLAGFKRIFATYHCGHFTLRGLRRFSEFLIQFLIAKYIHVCRYSAQCHSRYFYILPSKYKIIYNGIPLPNSATKESVRARKSLFNKGFHIISVANLRAKKGFEYSLPALYELIKKYNDIYFHLVGGMLLEFSNDPTPQYIQEFIKNNNLSERIIVHGMVKDVQPLLISSDVFLCASEVELLPLSILEAMALGLPVIATDVGGVKEILCENGHQYGILIQPGKKDAIITACESLYLSPRKRKDYSEKSIQRSEVFSSEKTLIKYQQLYEDFFCRNKRIEI